MVEAHNRTRIAFIAKYVHTYEDFSVACRCKTTNDSKSTLKNNRNIQLIVFVSFLKMYS